MPEIIEKVRFPINCDMPRRKTEYLYRSQELLRILHNGFSKWLHNGLTEEQYNLFPNKVKTKYSYVAKLSNADWDKFQKEDFYPRSNKINQAICEERAFLKNSTNWSIDIGEI